MSEVKHITEIAPANMPEWAEDAIDKGKFFNIAVAKIEALEQENERLCRIRDFYADATLELESIRKKNEQLKTALLYYGQGYANDGSGARVALGMTTEEVHKELSRIHQAVKI